LLFMLAFLVVPLAARAGAGENKERAAKTACLAGDYAKGVALLAELYVSSNNNVYLFNQGRCFEQNGKYEEAIVRFREYQLKNADEGNAPDESVQKHIEFCQALLDKQKPAAQQPAAVTAPASTAPVASLPAGAHAESKTSTVEVKPEARAEITEAAAPTTLGRGLRTAGVAVAAVGVLGIATGVILNLKANGLAKDLEAANGSSTTLYSRSTESSRSSYQTLGWVAYGAGAACVAGGTVLYLLGHSQGQNMRVTFVPAIGFGHVGTALQGAF
jgi:tetratricopeptide (TPR) repeat protein